MTDHPAVRRLRVLDSLTEVDLVGPHEEMLTSLAGDASHLKWLAAPTGRSLGAGATGTGDRFARTVADWTGELLTPAAADVLTGLALERPQAGVELASVLGAASWFRAGVGVDSFEGLGSLLDALEARPTTRRRALRYADVPGASPRAVFLFQAPPDPWGLLVSTDLDADSPAHPDDPAVGDAPVAVEEVVTPDPDADPSADAESDPPPGSASAGSDPPADARSRGDPQDAGDPDAGGTDGPDRGRTWLRRPGLRGHDLIDWQDRRGFDARAAGTVGDLHGALGRETPTDLLWERGRLRESLVYVYKETA